MDSPKSALEMIEHVEQDNLEVARKMATQKMATLDPEHQARRCGADVAEDDTGRHLAFGYLGTPVRVTIPGCKVLLPDGSEMNPYERVLVLHYITSDGPVPPDSDPITFKEVPSGAFYSAAFDRRAKNPLLGVFGDDPSRAVKAAESLGGRRADGGDVAVTVPAFPMVDITMVFYRADDEFPADVNLLLSSGITAYLSTEDIATVAGMTAYKLIKGART